MTPGMMDANMRRLLVKSMEPFASEYGIDLKHPPMEYFFSTSDLGNYTFIFPFETRLDRLKFFTNAHDTWIWSIIVSIAYIASIFGGQKLMANRKPFELRLPLIVWNMSMAIFSLIGFFRISNELLRVLHNRGFVFSICYSTYASDPVASFWILLFVQSKFIELIDTAFIVLRKRPLIFLHWYHHVTVLVFCWHSAKGVTAAGRWYAWMNYGVHTLMYSYYAAHAMSYRPSKWIQMSVTTLQITQMITGVFISYVVYKAKSDWNARCYQTWDNLRFALAIYISYFILFAKYFYDAYVKPRCKVIIEIRPEFKDKIQVNGVNKKVQ